MRRGCWLGCAVWLACGGSSGSVPARGAPSGSPSPATAPLAVPVLRDAPLAPTVPFAAHLDGTGSRASTSGGTIQGCSWDFGDGSRGEGCVVDHTYLSAGTFSVALRVTDSTGRSASQTLAVEVRSAAEADIAWTRVGTRGVVVDPAGAVYTTTDAGLEKLTPEGDVAWQRASSMRPTSASRAFVYGTDLVQAGGGPLPQELRIASDGTATEALGSGSDTLQRRIVAAPDDSRVELDSSPNESVLSFTGSDGSEWTISGGPEEAFFDQLAFAPDGSVIVCGRTAGAWSVQGWSVPGQTAFWMEVDSTGRIGWIRSVGDLTWSGLGVAGDGTVFALAAAQSDVAWGGTTLPAGRSAVLSVLPDGGPAGIREVDGAQSLAVAQDGSVAVLAAGFDACPVARVLTFDRALAAETSREIAPADCANGSVDPLGIAASGGRWVVNVHALGALRAGGETVSAPGQSTDVLITYR